MAQGIIRQATVEDIQQIQFLNQDGFLYDMEFDNTIDMTWCESQRSQEYYKNRIKYGAVFVYEEKNTDNVPELHGFIMGVQKEIEEYRKKEPIAEVEILFVSEEFRRNGIGEKLLKEFENWCKDRDIMRIKILVSAQNTKAISFYTKNNYDEYTVVMERSLRERN